MKREPVGTRPAPLVSFVTSLPPQAAKTPLPSPGAAGVMNRLLQPIHMRFRNIASAHSATSASVAGSGTTLSVSEGDVAAFLRV